MEASLGYASPLESLAREHWDNGPFSKIKQWVSKLAPSEGGKFNSAVELGCGVGGLYPTLKLWIKNYLGVDRFSASIALARHVALGMPYRGRIPCRKI